MLRALACCVTHHRSLAVAFVVATLTLGCAEAKSPPPLLALGELPLSKSLLDLQQREGTVGISLDELRVGGLKCLTLRNGRLLPGDIDATGIPVLLRALSTQAPPSPLTIEAHAMLPQETIVLLARTLAHAKITSVAFRARNPAAPLVAGWLVIPHLEAAAEQGGASARPWADVVLSWERLHASCRWVRSASCSRPAAASALDGQMRMALALLPDSARLTFRSVNAPQVRANVRPMVADHRAFLAPEDVEGGSLAHLATEASFRWSQVSLVAPGEAFGPGFAQFCAQGHCDLYVEPGPYTLSSLVSALGAVFATPTVPGMIVLESY